MKNLTIILLVLFFAMSAEGTIQNSKNYTGIVKFYNNEKGFGYIVDAATKQDLYVYDESLIDEISANDKVVYKVRDTRKGIEAFDVRLK